ncbi:methionine adenosyltransferase [Candidatus Woesebacteria bacterium]|nr:methionine adenosyltransferase [Candidatus Woesebacteria bacterium]
MNYPKFTSESVCSGHPDKICDAISDAIVDAALALDPYSRVAVETLVTKNFVTIAGEVTTNAKLNYESIAKKTIASLGYTDPHFYFSDSSEIKIKIHTQSPEISQGVDVDGAGDQGMMFGYACLQTNSYMPFPIQMAHDITAALDSARESKTISYLRPDGKAQVTIAYEGNIPKSVDSLVIAVPCEEHITRETLAHDLYTVVVLPILEKYKLKFIEKELVVNGTGLWHIGGPASDTGVTGRKIVVDTYGGYARAGGGAFSGKDPTKVDRSGAYAARYLAKNIVAQGLASECEVALAYYIGAKFPVMQEYETFGTAKASSRVIRDFSKQLLDTSVKGIIDGLDLRRPIYRKTASGGHFGRVEFPWEKIK